MFRQQIASPLASSTSIQVAVFPWRYVPKIGPANSLSASA